MGFGRKQQCDKLAEKVDFDDDEQNFLIQEKLPKYEFPSPRLY